MAKDRHRETVLTRLRGFPNQPNPGTAEIEGESTDGWRYFKGEQGDRLRYRNGEWQHSPTGDEKDFETIEDEQTIERLQPLLEQEPESTLSGLAPEDQGERSTLSQGREEQADTTNTDEAALSGGFAGPAFTPDEIDEMADDELRRVVREGELELGMVYQENADTMPIEDLRSQAREALKRRHRNANRSTLSQGE